jgi:hypothetical protein
MKGVSEEPVVANNWTYERESNKRMEEVTQS